MPYMPVASNLNEILFSVHFGTAAIGSFEEQCIDINEAMVWAFNAVFDTNKYIGIGANYFTQLLSLI